MRMLRRKPDETQRLGQYESFASPYRVTSRLSTMPGKNFYWQSKQRKSLSINLDFLSTNI